MIYKAGVDTECQEGFIRDLQGLFDEFGREASVTLKGTNYNVAGWGARLQLLFNRHTGLFDPTYHRDVMEYIQILYRKGALTQVQAVSRYMRGVGWFKLTPNASVAPVLRKVALTSAMKLYDVTNDSTVDFDTRRSPILGEAECRLLLLYL